MALAIFGNGQEFRSLHVSAVAPVSSRQPLVNQRMD